MKKAIIVSAFLIILGTLFCVRPLAADGGEYIISGDGDACTLYIYADGVPEAVCTGPLGELIGKTSGKRVTLDGVVSRGRVDIPDGSYTVSGTLTSYGDITVPEGVQLNLIKASIVFADECGMLVRGGEVYSDASEISSEMGVAITLDYSTFSRFVMTDSTVCSSNGSAALCVKSGEAKLLNGEITNGGGPAIYTDSYITLGAKLSGVGADIRTNKPIRLLPDYTPDSTVRIAYNSKFENGRLTEIVYGATGSSISGFTLTDADGRAEELTYFSSHSSTSSEDFLAVYKPYKVRTHIGGVISESEYLFGEALLPPFAQAPTGYKLAGWYTDREYNTSLAGDARVTDNMDIYAKFTLLPPNFTASTLEFVYDGVERRLGIENLSHILDGSGGMYSFEWELNGETVGRGSFISVGKVRDSGIYTCKITYRHGISEVTVTVNDITVSVQPATVTIPTLDELEYTGSDIVPFLPTSPLYEAEITSAVSAGTYPVRLRLTDPENYNFYGTEDDEINVYYRVKKGENTWQKELSVYNVYEEVVPNFEAISKFGEVKYLYSSACDGAYSEVIPTAAGTYYVIAIVEETNDFTSLRSSPQEFRILPDGVDHILISSMPNVTEYRAFDTFIPDGLSVIAYYLSGRSETVTAERLSVSYQQGGSFLYGDNAVFISYLGARTTCKVEVGRAVYDLSSIKFDSRVTTYSSSYQSISPSPDYLVGLDGIPLYFNLSGGGMNVGEYEITLSFTTDSQNYIIPNSLTAKLTIVPYTAKITWQNTNFVYNGNIQSPLALYVDVHGAIRYAIVSGGAVDAGDNYTATAASPDPNYTLTESQCGFSIAKADYDVSGAVWSDTELSYTGSPLSVSLSGLPSGLSVIGYVDAIGTDCGEYIARAILSYDETNYNSPPTLTHKWRIAPIEYDVGGYSFDNSQFVYDGKIHYPAFFGEMPVGIDGYPLGYSFSGGATHVSEGRVEVTVTFSTESKNYVLPLPITLYVEILPLGINVSWIGDEFVYSGSPISPTAYSPFTEIAVWGEAVNAGEHLALCRSLNTDYFVLNAEHPFKVKKASNRWLVTPGITDVYEGRLPLPVGEALYGAPEYSYYSDPDCANRVESFSPGVYYAIASVGESENYLPLLSKPISFQVIEVVPVKLVAVLLAERLTAFSCVEDSDISLSLRYNDGSSYGIPLSEATVSYQSADSLRRFDTGVSFSYGGFSVELPLTVEYAQYDLSAARWSQDVFIYDSLPKLPELSGLPVGVSVKGYSISPVTNAGVYSVKAYLSYDSENYLEPQLPAYSFKVLPCSVPIPKIDGREYDGNYYIPQSPSYLYTYSEIVPERFVGEYYLLAGLCDPVNYVFEDGTVAQSVCYSITPRTLYFTVSDFDLYLWETEIKPQFIMSGGEVIEGDDLMLSAQVLDGVITLRTENPNYRLSVSEGRVNSLGYPSPEVTAIIIITVLLLLAFTLFAIVLYSERERILDFIAIVRYRCSGKKRLSEVRVGDACIGKSLGNVSVCEEDSEPADTEYCPEAPLYDDSTDDSECVDTENDTNNSERKNDGYEDDRKEECSLIDGSILEEIESVDSERADVLITDSLAKNLLKRRREIVFTDGDGRSVINVDTLSRNFSRGDRVDVNVLKERCLIPYDTAYLKVLARGALDKALSVYANDFSLSAVKMIALTGGESVRVITRKPKANDEKVKNTHKN